MKKPPLLLVGMLLSILLYGQVPTTNLVKSYLFTSGSLQNTINPGTKDLVKTGSASSLITSNYLIANDAISLNGDYMHGGTSAGSINVSVSMWIKTSTNDASMRYIFSQFNSTPGFGVKCYLQNGRVVFGGSYKQSASASAFNSVTSLNSLADGKWHHVTATTTKITTSVVVGQSPENYFRYFLYIDGVLQGVASNGPTIYVISLLDNVTNFMVGSDNALLGARYEDAVDDIRYYERTLSDSEVQTLYLDNIPEGPVYVNKAATGNNDGSSWADAYTNLQSALSTYISKKTIWVAEGTYTPHAWDRKGTFSLPASCKIYGGFNGTETDIAQRDPKTNITVLSGDLLGNDNANIVVTESSRLDNAYHVVSIKGNAQNIIMDGFTISGGNASGGNAVTCATAAASQFNDQRGAAIYANPYVANQSITAMFRNCIIEKNTGYNVGVFSSYTPCGVSNLNIDVDFESCIIRDNRTRDLSAMLFAGSNGFGNFARGSIVNCLFYNNTSDNGSSCLYLASSTANSGTATSLDVQIINSTFANNTGANGNVMTMIIASNSVIRNSIIYGNGSVTPFAVTTSGSVVNNSIVQGGQLSGLNSDPLYKNTGINDYSLSCGSPAMNTGNNAYTSVTTDLAGGNRKVGTIDMGAYEFVPFSAITAVGKNVTIQLDANGDASLTPEQVDNGSGAVCGVAFTLSVSKTNFTCADLGANAVTLTATETVGGALSSTPVTVTVVDASAPTVSTQNITIQLNAAGVASATAAAVNNASYDNCTASFNLVLSLSKTSFTCADLGANVVTLTVEDASGNQSTATATVTVEDNVVPAALAQNVTVQLNASGNVSVTAASINNSSTDNCTAGGSLVLSLDKTTFTCADIGNNVVTLTVEDASGNVSTTTATVTVEDTVVPTVLAKNITVNLDNDGNASITATDIDNGSTDNCTDQANLITTIDVADFTLANVGPNVVTLTVTDANGNSNTATSTVTVVDKTEQTITFSALTSKLYGSGNFTLSATASSGLPVSYTVVSGAATIEGSTVSITGVGDVTIEATQAGDAEFTPAPSVQQSFTVNPAVLTITATNHTITHGAALPTLTYTYSGFVAEESAAVLTSTPTIETTATASSDAGSYPITLSGGSALNYAITLLDGTLIINKANQTVSITSISNKNIDDAAFSVVASTTSGLALSYEVTGPATITGTLITLTGTAGTVTVTASQAGTININATSASTSFQVIDNSKQAQTITFNAIADQILEEGTLTLSATASSGLVVTFQLVSGPATISGNVVSFNNLGVVVVRANQVGNDSFHPATSVERSFTIATITGVEEKMMGVHMYPNPVSDYLQIEMQQSEDAQISLLTNDGREIWSKPYTTERIDISALNKGIYFVRVQTADKTLTRKIIKN